MEGDSATADLLVFSLEPLVSAGFTVATAPLEVMRHEGLGILLEIVDRFVPMPRHHPRPPVTVTSRHRHHPPTPITTAHARAGVTSHMTLLIAGLLMRPIPTMKDISC
jgi:hypothetical protein|tara:strand:- start:1383 stop:1706 length:324 start_codon:yes stop_codon:yes gene_type:complete